MRIGKPLEEALQGGGPTHESRPDRQDLRSLQAKIRAAASQMQRGHGSTIEDPTIREEVEKRTKQLEERLKSKDEFLTNTVHELRTPLTTMLASLDMLQDGYAVTPEDQKIFLDQAAVATRHLTFLINDVLDSAAFEAGKLTLDLRRCFLREITQDVERLMVPLAKAHRVNLVIEHPLDDLAVIGDQGRILQVIFNLVSNSVKYSAERSKVVLRAIATSAGAVFEVEDEGIGVPMAARKSLFTRFSKVHSPDKPGVPGNGIGLYVSRMLVELMNGCIGFRERDEGQGSVFWFTLPIARADLRPSSPEDSVQHASS
jgi:signal transduction histidine kinase